MEENTSTLSFEQIENHNYLKFFEKQMKHDDLRILDRHIEYDKNKDEVKYLTYLLAKNEDDGDFGYCVKVVKLCKLKNVPKELREKKALMVLMDELLSSVWHKKINFINIYANIVAEDSQKLGFIYCYGLQETEVIQEETSYYSKHATKEEKISATLKKLKRQADLNYEGLIRLFRGTFRQAMLQPLSIEEGEAIRDAIETGKHLQVLRGIPKTHISSASGVTTSINGITTTPDGVEQNEEFIRALLHDHYVMVNMAFPIPFESILTWSNITAQELARYKSQYAGTKGYNSSISIPFVFTNSASLTTGTTDGFTDTSSYNSGVASGLSENSAHNVGENQGVSHNLGYSRGENLGVADSISQANTHSLSNGVSNSNSLTDSHGTSNTVTDGVTDGITESTGIAKSHSVSQSEGYATSQSISDSVSHSTGRSHSIGNTTGITDGTTVSHSQGVTDSTGTTIGRTNTHGITDSTGTSTGLSHGTSSSVSNGNTVTQGHTVSDALSHTDGKSHSDTRTNTTGTAVSDGFGTNSGNSGSIAHNEGNTLGVGGNAKFVVAGANASISSTTGDSISSGYNEGSSTNHSNTTTNSSSVGTSDGTSTSDGRTHSVANSNSISKSATFSNGISDSISQGTSTGHSVSNAVSDSLSNSRTHSISNTIGNSLSHSVSNSHSVTDGTSTSDSVGQTTSRGVTHSLGKSVSDGITESTSTAKSHSASHSVSKGVSDSQSVGSSTGTSKSLSDGVSVGQGKTSSRGFSESLSDGQGVSKGVSVGDSRGQGVSKTNSEGLGNSQGISNAISNATGLGQGMNFSFGPSIGYSRSFNVFDEEKGLLIRILEEMNERAILATNTGLFFVDSYIITHEEESKAGVSLAARSSWGGNTKLGTVQAVDLDSYTTAHLLKHVSVFEPCTMKDDIPNIVDNYLWSTALLTSELAAFTHLPRVEAGGLSTVANNIPAFSVIAPKKGDFYLGKQINYEDGIAFHDFNFSKDEFMHTLVCGATGSGKTSSSIRIAREIIQKDPTMNILALDWKKSWRVLQKFASSNDEFGFYSLDPHGINPMKTNLYVPPKYIPILQWRDKVNISLCVGYGFGNKMLALLNQVTDYLFTKEGIIIKDDQGGVKEAKDALEKIYNVSLAEVYHIIFLLKSGNEIAELKAAGKGMADAYDSILGKLAKFYSGELREMYCCKNKEECILPHELINGKRIMVIEGGELDDEPKTAILSMLSWGFFLYSKMRKLRERIVEKRFFILEEAHRVVVDRETKQQPLQLNEDIFDIMFNESREYGIYLMPIVQSPSHLPPSAITNCTIIIVHRLGYGDDLNLMTTNLARNARLDNRDIPIWITQQPIGQAIVRINNTRSHLQSDPILVQIARCEATPPDEEQLLSILDIDIPSFIQEDIENDELISTEDLERKYFM